MTHRHRRPTEGPAIASAGSTLAARSLGTDRERARTLAQGLLLLGRALLAVAGASGFFVDATFDTSRTTAGDPVAGGNANGQLHGDGLPGLEVNGWHDVVHLVSEIVLLLLASKRGSVRLAAIAFGLTYAVVAIIAAIDGNDVIGLIR